MCQPKKPRKRRRQNEAKQHREAGQKEKPDEKLGALEF